MPTGVAGQLPDNLSEYMKLGRSMRPGPITGGIECFSYSIAALPTVAALRERAIHYISGRYTIQAVTWNTRSFTGTPNLRIDANLLADPYTSGIAIKGSIELSSIPQGIDRSSALVNTDIDGDTNPWLAIALNMGSASLTDLSVTVWYFREGHVNADVVDD